MISILSTCVLHGVYVLLKDLLSQYFLGQGVGHMTQLAGVNLRITLQLCNVFDAVVRSSFQRIKPSNKYIWKLLALNTGSCEKWKNILIRTTFFFYFNF
jgi:hypothetical protein